MEHDVQVVNLSKNSLKEGIGGFKRILEVISILKEVFQKRKSADIIYFTISESLAGNIKDLFIYFICKRHLSAMYIHLHGGSIKRLLWDRYPLLLRLNKMFVRKLAGAIEILFKPSSRSGHWVLNTVSINLFSPLEGEYLYGSAACFATKV